MIGSHIHGRDKSGKRNNTSRDKTNPDHVVGYFDKKVKCEIELSSPILSWS